MFGDVVGPVQWKCCSVLADAKKSELSLTPCSAQSLMTFSERTLADDARKAAQPGHDATSFSKKLVSSCRMCIVYHESGPTMSASVVDSVMSTGHAGLPNPVPNHCNGRSTAASHRLNGQGFVGQITAFGHRHTFTTLLKSARGICC